MADINAIIEGLQAKFNAEAASGMDEVFQFILEDSDDYHIIIRNGECNILPGEHDDPSVTLVTNKATLKAVLSGELKGMQAFMSGKLRIEGDMLLATQLSNLF